MMLMHMEWIHRETPQFKLIEIQIKKRYVAPYYEQISIKEELELAHLEQGTSSGKVCEMLIF